MKSILDPTFKYVKAAETDLRKTFARIRREQLKAEVARKENEQEAAKKVTQLVHKMNE